MPAQPPSLFKGQVLHLVFLVAATLGLYSWSNPSASQWLGVSVSAWFGIAIATPIVHQIYVLICWRLQLQSQFITNKWGADRGFVLYVIGFFILFGGRFVTLLLLALADKESLSMSMELRFIIGVPILLLAGYTMYSVKRYFGFRRAAGIDHFDESYRHKPFVRQGMFKWTKNAMYVFALQGTWLFGIFAASKLALIAAAFQTIYIWIHYFGTEKPDMDWIYRSGEAK